MIFTEQTRGNILERILYVGKTKDGKSMHAMLTAQALLQRDFPDKKIVVLDLERNATAAMTPQFKFDVAPPVTKFHPEIVGKFLKAAEEQGYGVAVIDGFERLWEGPRGTKEQAILAANRNYGGNTIAGWSDGGKIQNEMTGSILSCGLHIVGTCLGKWTIHPPKKGKKVEKAVFDIVQRHNFPAIWRTLGYCEREENIHMVRFESHYSEVDGLVTEDMDVAWVTDNLLINKEN